MKSQDQHPAPPSPRALTHRSRLSAEFLIVVYIAVIAALAHFLGIPYLLFPELGALVYDVLIRPWGKWASQPTKLVVTPAITAFLGTVVTRHFSFNGLTVLLIVALSTLVIALLHSSIAPAMSAGVLPLVLGVKSWLYPSSIILTLIALSAISVIWRKYHLRSASQPEPSPDVEDILESLPHGRMWLVVFLVFVVVAAEVARLSGLRFILFPPLVTMAYEMFGHPETCPWTKRPISLPVSCFVVAFCGLLVFHAFGANMGAAASACAMVCGIVVLRIFDLHMPPAMAVGLLPAVMISPDLKFPFAVLAGTLFLTGSFLLYQRFGPRVAGPDRISAPNGMDGLSES